MIKFIITLLIKIIKLSLLAIYIIYIVIYFRLSLLFILRYQFCYLLFIYISKMIP